MLINPREISCIVSDSDCEQELRDLQTSQTVSDPKRARERARERNMAATSTNKPVVDLGVARGLLLWVGTGGVPTAFAYAMNPAATKEERQREEDRWAMVTVFAHELEEAMRADPELEGDSWKVPIGAWPGTGKGSNKLLLEMGRAMLSDWAEATELLRVLRGGGTAITSLEGAMAFVESCSDVRTRAKFTADAVVERVRNELPKRGGPRRVLVRVCPTKRYDPEDGAPWVEVYMVATRMTEAEKREEEIAARIRTTGDRVNAKVKEVLLKTLYPKDSFQLHRDGGEGFVPLVENFLKSKAYQAFKQTFKVDVDAGLVDGKPTPADAEGLFGKMVDMYAKALAMNVALWRREANCPAGACVIVGVQTSMVNKLKVKVTIRAAIGPHVEEKKAPAPAPMPPVSVPAPAPEPELAPKPARTLVMSK